MQMADNQRIVLHFDGANPLKPHKPQHHDTTRANKTL